METYANCFKNSYMEQIITLSIAEANKHEFLKIITEAKTSREYINASFIDTSNIYGSTSCPGIDDHWREFIITRCT